MDRGRPQVASSATLHFSEAFTDTIPVLLQWVFRWSINRIGKPLNSPQSLRIKESDFHSEDWGFESLCDGKISDS